jgi:hypothetical protein
MSKNPKMEKLLARFEPGRRKSLRNLAVGTGVFVAPVVASFSMQGLGGSAHAQAQYPNQPPAASSSPVPTLSPAALAVTAGLVTGAAALAMRQRRKNK